MIWRINKFSLTNFKFFKGVFTIEPCGKNVLLYAENGCGKSSIFWGFYTLYESCKKDPDLTGAQKYFDDNNTDNLRNKFSTSGDYSGLKIEFIDQNNHTRSYEDSSKLVNTKESTSVFMPLTRSASDFLHYKHLSSLFDFKNSQDNDVFDIFRTELFPYLDFPTAISSTDFELNVKAWWDKIFNGKNAFAQHVNRSSPAYCEYQKSISDFNRGLCRLLDSIINRANERIGNDFKLPIELVCNYSDCTFDNHIGNRRYDKLFSCPKIILTAKMKHCLLPKGETSVGRMRSFFNEAKISCMALALRLAILDLKVSVGSLDHARSLFIDDLLISLDMSHRLMIVDVLLGLANKYQLFLFTHDRALYSMVSEKVDDNLWKKYELIPITDFAQGGIPSVKLVNKLTPILWAHKYYKKGDFYACANALRKECERQTKRLLKPTDVWSVNHDGEAKIRDLSILLDLLPIFFSEYGLTNLTPNIQIYRKHILNPGSHDDVFNTIYRGELQMALMEIEKLSRINIFHKVANTTDGEYELSVTNGIHHSSITFNFIQPLSLVIYEGNNYFGNPSVSVIAENGSTLSNKRVFPFASAINHVCNMAHGLSSSVVNPLDCCTKVAIGKTLREMLKVL